MAAETSLRELMRKAVDVRTSSVVVGKVTKTNPLEIRVANDAKLILSEGNVYVPKHLTDYKVAIEFDMETLEALGEHSHGYSGTTNSQLGSHSHSYSGTTSDGQTFSGNTGGADEAHAHSVSGNTESADMKHTHKISGARECVIKNALQVGDEVYILVYQEGSMYFVLDKVG